MPPFEWAPSVRFPPLGLEAATGEIAHAFRSALFGLQRAGGLADHDAIPVIPPAGSDCLRRVGYGPSAISWRPAKSRPIAVVRLAPGMGTAAVEATADLIHISVAFRNALKLKTSPKKSHRINDRLCSNCCIKTH